MLEGMLDITIMLVALVALVSFLIARFAVPYIKQKLPAGSMETLEKIATIAVLAMETIYGPGFGEEKLSDALSWAQKQLNRLGIRFEKEDIINAINAQWQIMNTRQIETGIKKPPDHGIQGDNG